MELNRESTIRKFFENQGLHIIILATLFYSFDQTYLYLDIPVGEWLGLTTRQWFLIALISPLIHQPYVWICWRGELYYKALSKLMGRHAFVVFSTVFFC